MKFLLPGGHNPASLLSDAPILTCLISALLHAHLVRFEIVLQIASAAAPGELGAVLGRLIEVVPIVDTLARAWIFWSKAFFYWRHKKQTSSL